MWYIMSVRMGLMWYIVVSEDGVNVTVVSGDGVNVI